MLKIEGPPVLHHLHATHSLVSYSKHELLSIIAQPNTHRLVRPQMLWGIAENA